MNLVIYRKTNTFKYKIDTLIFDLDTLVLSRIISDNKKIAITDFSYKINNYDTKDYEVYIDLVKQKCISLFSNTNYIHLQEIFVSDLSQRTYFEYQINSIIQFIIKQYRIEKIIYKNYQTTSFKYSNNDNYVFQNYIILKKKIVQIVKNLGKNLFVFFKKDGFQLRIKAKDAIYFIGSYYLSKVKKNSNFFEKTKYNIFLGSYSYKSVDSGTINIVDKQKIIRDTFKQLPQFMLFKFSNNDFFSKLLSFHIYDDLFSLSINYINFNRFFYSIDNKVKIIINSPATSSAKLISTLAQKNGNKVYLLPNGALTIVKMFAMINPDFFFVWGDFYKELVQPYLNEKTKVIVAGAISINPRNVNAKKKENNPPNDYYIGVPTTAVSFSFFKWFLEIVINTIIYLNKENNNLILLVRFHPAETLESRTSILNILKETNVKYAIDKGTLDEFINASKIIISPNSTVGIEALLKSKISINLVKKGTISNFPYEKTKLKLVAYSKEDLIAALKYYIYNSTDKNNVRNEIQKTTSFFINSYGNKASSIIHKYI